MQGEHGACRARAHSVRTVRGSRHTCTRESAVQAWLSGARPSHLHASSPARRSPRLTVPLLCGGHLHRLQPLYGAVQQQQRHVAVSEGLGCRGWLVLQAAVRVARGSGGAPASCSLPHLGGVWVQQRLHRGLFGIVSACRRLVSAGLQAQSMQGPSINGKAREANCRAQLDDEG